MDLRTEKIDNRLILAGLASGYILQALLKFPDGVVSVIAGTVIPIVLCWIVFRMHGLGAGDIKLLAVIGSLNGSEILLTCLLFSCLLGAGYAIIVLLYRRQVRPAFRELFLYFQTIAVEKKIMAYPGSEDEKRKMHFSVVILYGYLLTVLVLSVSAWMHILQLFP